MTAFGAIIARSVSGFSKNAAPFLNMTDWARHERSLATKQIEIIAALTKEAWRSAPRARITTPTARPLPGLGPPQLARLRRAHDRMIGLPPRQTGWS